MSSRTPIFDALTFGVLLIIMLVVLAGFGTIAVIYAQKTEFLSQCVRSNNTPEDCAKAWSTL